MTENEIKENLHSTMYLFKPEKYWTIGYGH